jgi:glycosyltransferase involved in cell wall biosynthesis
MKLVWFSEIKWTYLRTRKQQLLRRLPPDWSILFIEPYVRNRDNTRSPRTEGRVTYATIPFMKSTPSRLLNHLQSIGVVRSLWERLTFRRVGRLLRETGFDRPDVVCTSNIFYANIIRRLRPPLVVYDLNDYPLGFVNHLPSAPAYFERTLQVADRVVTTSATQMEFVRPFRREGCAIIGNGVDYSLFAAGAQAPAPEELRTLARPIICFSGVFASWVNVDLLAAIASRAPSASLVLIGPIREPATREQMSRLQKLPNVRYLGERPHDRLPPYLAHADLGVLPFHVTRRTQGANPNTMYEFLAAGTPVVTFGLSAEVRALAPDIDVVDTEEEFVAAVLKRLGRDDADPTRLTAIAEANDWRRKADDYAALIRRALSKVDPAMAPPRPAVL